MFVNVEGFIFTIMSRTKTHIEHSDCNAIVLVVSLGALEVQEAALKSFGMNLYLCVCIIVWKARFYQPIFIPCICFG